MKQTKLITIGIAFFVFGAQAQTESSDNKFQRPLTDVLSDIEQRYHVKLRISGEPIDDKVLNYANWRFRPDVIQTLQNVLAPFDLIALPDGDPDKFKIEGFRYHRRTVEEAKEFLKYLESLYSDKTVWEKRKTDLKECLPAAVGLPTAPATPKSAPLIARKRKMKGYTIENIALEVLPGVYAAGSIYKPAKIKGKIPVVLCPNGHFKHGRYNKDVQLRCAGLARMGAVAVSYDLFAWGESSLQFEMKYHQKALANTMQILNSQRLLDYLLTLDYIDPERIGITGGSGGGSHSILMAALDGRIGVSVPAVMMSATHYGGCPCESGSPIHLCGGGTNNVEMAGLFAPKPQLIISDGGDWTTNVPGLEFPFLKRIYGFYGAEYLVDNKHFADEGHDYGVSKRTAMYRFMARHLKLDEMKVFDKNGNLDESAIAVENESALKVFGEDGQSLPSNAIRSFEELESMFR